jgi:hypothetical protein
MDPHDETSPKPRTPQVKIPPDVERRLRQAISEHLLTYRSKHYERLRELPEFRPYIGLHLGETGRKRLTRLIAEVRATAPSTRRTPPPGPAAGTAERHQAEPAAPPTCQPVVITASEALAAAVPVLVGYAQLQQMVQRRLPELEGAIAACKNELGEIIDPRSYIKLGQELRATVDAVAKLADRFQAQFGNSRFLIGLKSLIAEEFAHEPERHAGFEARVGMLAAQCHGLMPEKE